MEAKPPTIEELEEMSENMWNEEEWAELQAYQTKMNEMREKRAKLENELELLEIEWMIEITKRNKNLKKGKILGIKLHISKSFMDDLKSEYGDNFGIEKTHFNNFEIFEIIEGEEEDTFCEICHKKLHEQKIIETMEDGTNIYELDQDDDFMCYECRQKDNFKKGIDYQ
jgi:hypothetical protein